MAIKAYDEAYIKAIADKIREKSGDINTYKTSEMPSGIENVYLKGTIDGKEEILPDIDNAYNGGLHVGFENGSIYGSTAMHKKLWNSVKHYTNEWYYTFAGAYWNDTTFDPLYDLVPPAAIQLFYQSQITDLKGILERNGVKLDFSKCKRFQSIFEQSKITRCPEIDTRSCDNLSHFLYNAASLESVDKIIFKDDGSQTWSELAFKYCKSLSEVTFEGVIGNSIDFSSCPFSKASMFSVFEVLSDTATGKTISFKKDNVYDMFRDSNTDEYVLNDEWSELVATKPNWTVKLV